MSCNKLILGTVQFGLDYGINNLKGKPSDDTIKRTLDLAYNNGIEYLDTAEAYGDSQERIGFYHNSSSNKFKVITKFSSSITKLSGDIETRVLQNLKTLDVDSLYCYMFHSFNDFDLFFDKFKSNLISLKNKGILNKIGVSIYTNEELEKVLEFKEISLIQIPFNLFDNDNLRGDVLRKAKKKGIEIHTRSVFLQGLFFKEKDNLEGNLKDFKSPLESLEKLSKENNVLISDIALNYACKNISIDKVLVGVDDEEQLSMNIKSINKTIDESVFNEINKIKIHRNELLNPSNW